MTIKELRLMKGMTLANFAKAIGIGMSTLTSYEAGKRAPSEKALAAIKEVYGVDLNEAAPAPAAEEAAPVKEKKAAAKKSAAKKEVKAKAEPAKKEKAAKAAPAAKKEATAKAAPAAKKEAKAKAEPAVKKEATSKAAPAAKKEAKEKKAPAKKAAPAAKKEAKKSKAAEIIIQSSMGGEITPEEIMSRIGDVDKVYIRIDQNAAYWIKGEESGSVNLW